MDLNGLNSAIGMVFGVFLLIGLASVLDCHFRGMAQEKARRAELARFVKWGLPPGRPTEPVKVDEHLWHF